MFSIENKLNKDNLLGKNGKQLNLWQCFKLKRTLLCTKTWANQAFFWFTVKIVPASSCETVLLMKKEERNPVRVGNLHQKRFRHKRQNLRSSFFKNG
ncbi:hypothetical protein [Holdemania sp. Marseille-P2844]|uniref:hypothetical protein n=1 Tax=Holdemania sp. Marseille-P2844 TaxID=1852366 RepID=UPI000A91DBA1|nr:hypothetical protein [Holdemania sp. Marseille-P2844]